MALDQRMANLTSGLRRSEAATANGENRFKRVGYRHPSPAAGRQPGDRAFLTRLSADVIDRFARITGLQVVTIPLDLPQAAGCGGAPDKPDHPACATFSDTEYCRDSWQSHLAELRCKPEVHWHRCDFGLLCAIVPVVWRRRCLAVLKLVSQNSMREEAFERNVELLDVLVEGFVASEASFLSRLVLPDRPGADGNSASLPETTEAAARRPDHPQVLRAMDLIDEHLCDPNLTVGRVARELGLNSTYLAHIFAEQVGERMSRRISGRRIELAKTLLATTNWQIKRVAYESGHANPDWFSHVFRARAGLTPGEYRRRVRAG